MKYAILGVILLFATSVHAFTGKVVGVHDGDTITVLTAENVQVKVRLSAIDAPEIKQAFGTRSRQSLADMVFGKTVEIPGTSKDRYRRIVSKVILDGVDINLAQIKRGMAWHYKQYSKSKAYANAENDARAAHVGLWSDPHAIAPWEFRHPKK